jgi:hypothetical protein
MRPKNAPRPTSTLRAVARSSERRLRLDLRLLTAIALLHSLVSYQKSGVYTTYGNRTSTGYYFLGRDGNAGARPYSSSFCRARVTSSFLAASVERSSGSGVFPHLGRPNGKRCGWSLADVANAPVTYGGRLTPMSRALSFPEGRLVGGRPFVVLFDICVYTQIRVFSPRPGWTTLPLSREELSRSSACNARGSRVSQKRLFSESRIQDPYRTESEQLRPA